MKKYILPVLFFSGIFLNASLAHANFSDIDTTHPNFHAIDSLQKSGIVQGYDVGGKRMYRSLQKISRAEALKILLLASNIEPSVNRSTFPDVPKDAWFESYVATARSKGLVKGFQDGNFYPHAQVSRAEFLKMAARAFDIPLEVSEETEGKAWYEPYFDFAQVFKVFEETDLSPQESLSRGELAEIIFRFSHVADTGFTKSYIYTGNGTASYYNEGFAGKTTANGETYDPMAMTAAHRTLPFGTRLKVWTNNNSDEFVVVRINDRGPYHSTRVIDLSEKAFSMLAPISRGVIEVDFEIFLENQEAREIPEEILSQVSLRAKSIPVPEEIKDHLQSTPEDEKTSYKIPEKKEPQSVFDDSVPYLSPKFFPNMTLREAFPQKIRTGSVLSIAGTLYESGHKKVTVFLQPIDVSGQPLDEVSQTIFSGEISGKNFSLPVSFLRAGKYHMGVVFDDERKSRVAEITVTKEGQDQRYFAPTEDPFPAGLQIHLLPEEKKVRFSWPIDSDRKQLTKLVFSAPGAKEHSQTLFVEHGLTELVLDYDFFEYFVPLSGGTGENITLSLDVYGAESASKTLNTQTTNWKKIEYQNFVLVPGFPDTESSKISIHDFVRFPKTLDPITLSGKILAPNTVLSEHAFLTDPDGNIGKIPVIMVGGEDFRIRVLPKKWGTHIFEITSSEGEVLFNRALYVSRDMILPVQPRKRILSRGTTTTSVKNWVNAWRSKYDISPVEMDTDLNAVAQQYANQMAADNFISHTSPTGITFEDRIKNANLQGEFAENLSFGTTLDLALDGLHDSASHFRQVVGSKWRSVGIGVAKNKDGFYIVQIFGR